MLSDLEQMRGFFMNYQSNKAEKRLKVHVNMCIVDLKIVIATRISLIEIKLVQLATGSLFADLNPRLNKE